MATRIAIRMFFVLCFGMTSVALAQQPSGNQAGGKGGVPRAGVNGVGTPQCIYCPQPYAAADARTVNYGGTVLLDVTVITDGKVIDPKVIKGPGLGLNEKALAGVKRWNMKPALGRDGKPVDCRVQIEVTFYGSN
jgi:periplasmic protein TonB